MFIENTLCHKRNQVQVSIQTHISKTNSEDKFLNELQICHIENSRIYYLNKFIYIFYYNKTIFFQVSFFIVKVYYIC